ncbi:MAG: hypothetical protein P1P89_08215 [Desulfobacterales bacterium]|nr:hypothetical protein [Desulfobacterales bacterium]
MTKWTAEHHRILSYRNHGLNWKKWGPYLSERSWGTVREDYSADGSAWDFSPMIMRAARPIAGVKTALPVYQIVFSIYVLHWPFGTAGTRS